ncbi:auxilin-related protein 2-like [Mangifera indica]|uniref:auxilin-related protein 2-like n=1 Tax=Mangifera indica TaxID=29780 RepID=UPI001CF95BBB|nr:auxilin-related protein 2-like [Mangifera indica]
MDDFPGLLARDFGLKPQGKAAPMASSRANNFSTANSSFGLGSNNPSDFSKSSSLKSNHVFDDHDPDGFLFNDVFGGPPKYSSTSSVDSRAGNTFEYDSIFKDQSAKSKNSKANLMPSFDKPVYDDDIFEGLPGLKNSSVATSPPSSAKFDDVFSSISRSPPKQRRARESSPFDDLLGNLGKKENESRVKKEKDALVFDDLLSGFGRSSSSSGNRSTSESSGFQKPPSTSTKTASSMMEDPFVVLGSNSTPVGSSEVFTDPLEEVGKFSRSEGARMNGSSASGGTFDDLDPLNSLGKSVPPVSTEVSKRGEDRSPLRSGSVSGTQTYHSKESINRSSSENSEDYSRNRTPIDNFQGSHDPLFNMPSVSTDSLKSVGRSTSPPSYMSASPNEINSQINSTSRSEEIFESSDDIWLTVSEIPLSTQPTSAPPPSRSPPPRPTQHSKSEPSTDARKKVNDFPSVSNSPQYSNSPRSGRAAARGLVASQIDELEDFAMGRTWNNANEYGEVPPAEDVESSIAAAAMKEAMDRAEAKFRHAKEVRERESLRAARSKEPVQLDTDESATLDAQERLDRERQQREKVEEEREQRRLEREREREREREEREREQRRLEKERERAREIEKEREKARQAVERATREARERAAAEARLKAERAAVDKANAAARERAERAAVQRAQAEARERAAAEAKERADKAAAEARERANAEAREREARERASVARAERAAVERAAAEARERAAAAARANQNQPKNENDLESFFSMGARPSSAPRPRANSSDPLFDVHSKGGPEVGRRTSVGTTSNMKKASSETNIVDDLTSIFGAAGSSAGEFQEVEGETEERRKARLERHQRTQERAAKALAEKNQRDLQAQREQAERHRIAETLDAEVKRWAAGKEGNLRALLATLQYVLWPECGWQPVSLTDLITGAAVKKHYRKATLCIHPDKVQQKGANLQQKYIAEKVFDLLKESWNKFNSEELF